ncbi:WD40 repeat domain-containing protein [Cylindrospermum stagnale]|nr:WD40 repeat domain-containing protein [Cylindrospermum stagnale]
MQSRQEICTFTSAQDEVYSVAFSPDGKTLAAGCGDKTIILFPCQEAVMR